MVAASKISAKKQRANRLNARKSTGPRTLGGKARSAQNARTHGMFCHNLVLENEDVDSFNFIRMQFIQSLRPQNLLELSHVERIAEGNWRLLRLNQREADDENLRLNAKKHRAEILDQLSFFRDALPGDELPTVVVKNAARVLYGDAPIDPYSRAREKVEQSISRAARELRALQKPHVPAELPPSPYLEEQAEDDDEEIAEENPQNEPTAATNAATPDSATGCETSPIAPPGRVGFDNPHLPVGTSADSPDRIDPGPPSTSD